MFSENHNNKDGRVELIYIRHAQKASAETGKSGLSTSLLSPEGEDVAKVFGEALNRQDIQLRNVGTTTGPAGKNNRTQATAREILAGNNATDTEVRYEFNLGFYSEAFFQQGVSSGFFRYYNDIVYTKLCEILTRDFPVETERYKEYKSNPQTWFSQLLNSLSPNDQERVMQEAEEPAVEWYLSLDDKSPDDLAEVQGLNGPKDSGQKTISPKSAAVLAAKQVTSFYEENERLATQGGNFVEIPFIVGNQLASEPFLIYFVKAKLRKSSAGEFFWEDIVGTNVEKIRLLGGSLHTMEGWQLSFVTNKEGNINAILHFRNELYFMDFENIKNMAGVE